MGALFGFFVSLAGTLPGRVLMSLGIGWVTYSGFDAVFGQVKGAVLANWGGVTGSALQIMSLGGMHTAIGIILGAWGARVALMGVARLGKVS